MLLRIVLFLAISLLVVSCKKEAPEGVRSRVFFGGAKPALKASDAQNYAIDIPEVGQAGNPMFDNNGRTVWRASIGYVTRRALVEQPPLYAEGLIITVSANGLIVARDAKSGVLRWQVKTSCHDDYRLGGGLCYCNGVVYVSRPLGKVFAIDAKVGKILWEVSLESPLRSAPVANSQFVFVTTISNGLVCLRAKDGTQVWRDLAQEGTNSIVGGPAPILVSGNVIVGHSTGEISALRQENGHVHWRNTVSPESERLLLEDFLSWKAPFLYHDTSLYLVHPAGALIAMDMRNGAVSWKLGAGYLYPPALGNNVIFVVDMFGYMVCVETLHGKVLWVANLPLYENPTQKQKRPIYWAGPVLAGDKLILAGTDGTMLTVSPYTGQIISQTKISDAALYLPPIVVDKVAYFLDQNGEVIART